MTQPAVSAGMHTVLAFSGLPRKADPTIAVHSDCKKDMA